MNKIINEIRKCISIILLSLSFDILPDGKCKENIAKSMLKLFKNFKDFD